MSESQKESKKKSDMAIGKGVQIVCAIIGLVISMLIIAFTAWVMIEMDTSSMLIFLCGVLISIAQMTAVFFAIRLARKTVVRLQKISKENESLSAKEVSKTAHLTLRSIFTVALGGLFAGGILVAKVRKFCLKSWNKEEARKINRATLPAVTGILFGRMFLFLGGVFLVFCYFVPMTKIETRTVAEMSASTEFIDDDAMEVGDTQVIRAAENGETKITTEVKYRLIFGTEVSREDVSKEQTKAPVNAIVSKGTKKWQYMWCSDGTSYSYTDEQFATPSVGFTSKSPDACETSGHGAKTKLANEPPATRSNAAVNNNSGWTSNIYNYKPSTYTPSYTEPPTTSSGNTETPAVTCDEALKKYYENAYIYKTNSIRDYYSAQMQDVQRKLGAIGAGGGSAQQHALDDLRWKCNEELSKAKTEYLLRLQEINCEQ